MARVTDKLLDQNLKDIAVKKYEKQKLSRVPTEIVDLVSKGKVYPKSNPLSSGEIEMRYMTAYDEDILTSPTFLQKGIALDKLLEAIIISDINLNDLTVPDKNALIVDARILSYGKMYPVVITTPDNQTIETEVDLSKLDIIDITLDPDENGEFNYQINDTYNIKFRYPPATANTETKSEFLKHVIMQVNDSRVKNDIAEFIQYDFRIDDSKKFQKYFYENLPRLDLSVDINYTTTEGNQETFRAGFQLGTDLFWF